MKQFFIALACLTVCSITADAQKKTDKASPVKALQFKEVTHDFGVVAEGPAAEYAFEFVNKGKEPVVISNASASCGCTVPSWPKEPILPGKKGVIKVSYTTSGRPGPIQKAVYVKTNVQEAPFELHIKGTVKAKAGVTETAGVH